ncbi:MAG: sulfatase-like hydrolase/transferase [Myxococcota bacterium]|nr:sulfatase-like hydrolase/transferase [Myxococcota bacterium]
MRRPQSWPLWLLPLVVLACGPTPGAIDRPNLVVIIGDDHGYPYAGFMGSEVVRTPHLDRLAADGTVFTNAYNVASSCRPSLMGLLTGLDPYQVELRSKQLANRDRPRHEANRILDFHTLPSLLAQRGYRSFQVGKHWEGNALQAGFSAGSKASRPPGKWKLSDLAGGDSAREIGRTTMKPVWDFLEQAGDEPFLLWFAPMLPHTPLDAPHRYREPYIEAGLSNSAVAYYANITRLDVAIGQVLERLDEMALRERTLVVYLSDNGWDQPPHVEARRRSLILGGPHGKMSMYELGFRTPIVFQWEGHVAKGAVHDELVSTLDLFPTLLDYAGLAAPAGRLGQSLRPTIENGEPLLERSIYGRMAGALPETADAAARSVLDRLRKPASFARRGRWHFFAFETPAGKPVSEGQRLYDLEHDPEEMRDVAGAHPEIVAALGREIALWKKQARRSLPKPVNRMSTWTSSE